MENTKIIMKFVSLVDPRQRVFGWQNNEKLPNSCKNSLNSRYFTLRSQKLTKMRFLQYKGAPLFKNRIFVLLRVNFGLKIPKIGRKAKLTVNAYV